MPRYRVTHRATRQAYEVEAPFAQDACDRLGWLIGDCHVKLLREGPFTTMWDDPVPVRVDDWPAPAEDRDPAL